VAVLTKTSPLVYTEGPAPAEVRMQANQNNTNIGLMNDFDCSQDAEETAAVSAVAAAAAAAAATKEELDVVASEEAQTEMATFSGAAEDSEMAVDVAAETAKPAAKGKSDKPPRNSHMYKEDPFVFAAEQLEFLTSLREFYGVKDTFPVDQVATRYEFFV
jgi:hypothetical protein